MEEEGAAKLVNTAQVDGRTWNSYVTVGGEVFSVVRPEIGTEAEKEVREWKTSRYTQICERGRVTSE